MGGVGGGGSRAIKFLYEPAPIHCWALHLHSLSLANICVRTRRYAGMHTQASLGWALVHKTTYARCTYDLYGRINHRCIKSYSVFLLFNFSRVCSFNGRIISHLLVFFILVRESVHRPRLAYPEPIRSRYIWPKSVFYMIYLYERIHVYSLIVYILVLLIKSSR